ncbi:MAG: isoprenylcysteine carboxylmethyltransferase family protein [Chloroflexi bacterium]|nr:isoprenylcysteine carboxylmethyltransferase family protein [Chloroflexota bacterium]
MCKNLSSQKWKNLLWSTLLTILCIICFPVNPLILTGVIEAESYPALFIIGWVVWALGMVMVMAPIVMFPRRGGVPKGKSFVNTTHLVDTGIYTIVRHPQYTGGIYAIFLTTFLWYPHWLFGVLGVVGTAVIYMSCREEDQRLIEKFGDAYIAYMKRVPGMNFILGLVTLIHQKRNQQR